MESSMTVISMNSPAPQQEVSSLVSSYERYLDASSSTISTYTAQLRHFMDYLETRNIDHPARQDIVDYRNSLTAGGLKATTVDNYLNAVKLFFKWTEAEGLYPNIAEHVKGEKISRDHKRDYLTSSQIKSVLASIDTRTLTGKRDYAIISLTVTCGLRTIEISRALVGDLRPRGDQLVLYVQGKDRDEKSDYVKICPEVESAIRSYLSARGHSQDEDHLFTSASNRTAGDGALTTRSVSRIVKDRFRAAGLDSDRLTAHSLRHSAITLAIRGGEDVQQVQQFARHANLSTTMIYYHEQDQESNTCSSTISKAIF